MTSRIRVAPPAGLVANVLGVLGLLGLVAAAGGLTGNLWWSLLTGSVEMLGVSYAASTHVDADDAPGVATDRPAAPLERVA